MGDRLQAGIPSRYVTSQLGQLSLASVRSGDAAFCQITLTACCSYDDRWAKKAYNQKLRRRACGDIMRTSVTLTSTTDHCDETNSTLQGTEEPHCRTIIIIIIIIDIFRVA